MRKYELYAILDKEILGERNLIETAEELLERGVRIIQYRDKKSPLNKILENSLSLKNLNIPNLIINDHPAIAKEADANGVHLGQDDADIKEARKILGKNKIIGKSTHSLEQAKQAEREGVDYIGIGPIFKTNTKKDVFPIGLDVLKQVLNNISIPVVAIGGINQSNINCVLDTGAERIAMVSAILQESFSWGKYKKPEKGTLLLK